MTAPLIELRGITRTYGTGDTAVRVLHGIDLSIRHGDFVALRGQSGSGKTTLMNILGCLDTPTSGEYLFEGRDVSHLSADELAALRSEVFGFVFQRYNLIGTETALQNVAMPAIYRGQRAGEREARARSLLQRLGLAARATFRPSALSGGQQQRVSIARALMNGGRVILADEPTGALDSASGQEVLRLLHELHAEGHTIILITHDALVAAQARRVIEIADGLIVADCVVGDSVGCHAGPGDAAAAHPAANVGLAPPPVRANPLGDFAASCGMALRSLRNNMFRTALTLLGIVIGVAAVITMLAMGAGSKAEVLRSIEAMGPDLLVVRPGAPNIRGSSDVKTLTADDAQSLEGMPNVLHVVPENGKGITVRFGRNDYATNGVGTTAEYPLARSWEVLRGQFLSDTDVASYAPVAVIGTTVRDALFTEGEDPIGQRVLIENVPFEVIGVMSTKGESAFGSDLDDNVFVPITTGRMRLFGQSHVRAIALQLGDMNRSEETSAAVEDVIAARHRMVDFKVRNMASLIETATETQNTMSLLLGSIAAISLLVGGIGVMNIMLVSVTERIREIGIRMACGARRLQIQMQFLVEAVLVCAFGGLIGVALGFAAGYAAQAFGSPVIFSLPPVLMAFGSAFLVGVLFGFLPARRAARLDPVVALASE
jgi:macrolide transport system ATP-binding/permease protein